MNSNGRKKYETVQVKMETLIALLVLTSLLAVGNFESTSSRVGLELIHHETCNNGYTKNQIRECTKSHFCYV